MGLIRTRWFWRSLIFILCIGNLVLTYHHAALADNSSALDNAPAQKYVEDGWKAFQGGDAQQAISSWLRAVRSYEEAGKPKEQIETLTYLSHAYQSLGQYKNSLKSLAVALILAEKSEDRAQLALVLGTLGDAYITTGHEEKAFQYLDDGLRMARETGNAGLTAVILNNFGNLYTSQKKYKEAIDAYAESTTLGKKAGNRALVVRALTNAAIASTKNGQVQEAKTLLDRALDDINGLPQSNEKVLSLINVGLAYYDLVPRLTGIKDALSLTSAKLFNEALVVAETLGDRRGESYALGYLGKLYEDEHRYQEALQLTRRAVFVAQRANAPESLYKWEWQTGRLLKAQGNIEEAIWTYRRAVRTLQSIRQEISRGYGGVRSSFRESAGPVYFELVDLLLQRTDNMRERQQFEPYLLEARATVELLKAAELRDYFRDDCVDAARARVTKLDTVTESAVVVYPIILPDRLELLVNLRNSLKRISVPVGADILTQEVRAFRRMLEKRTTREYLPHAQRLYDWLIRPLEAELGAVTVGALVFVPDGPLRTIPMAALHDGRQFLINKYPVAITPGLDLTDPRPIKRENVKVLAAGLSESVQGFPPLPFVPGELEAIHGFYGGDQLLNQAFLVASMEKELKDQRFNIVHIASHGQFASEVDKTFLLTFDGKVTMDRLDQYVGLFRFRNDPLELLVLSACETAAGDDRAALGLAGIAIKAGARSALATLWVINDQSTSTLVTEFYRQLQDPGVSRAVALQRAQLKLHEDKRYEHPGYWSPFLLINNWL